MKITVVWVGKTKESFLAKGVAFYAERVSHYASLDIVEVRGERISAGSDEQSVKNREGERILARRQPGETLIALDERGTDFTSVEFSRFLRDMEERGLNRPCFVLGGPLGLSGEVVRQAYRTVSLSRMTLTHEMARLVLLEQIYRAMTIDRGEKYHK